MIYGCLGSLLAAIFSSVVINYFTSGVKYVADIFSVDFTLNGLGFSEFFFFTVACIFVGWLSAKIATNRHIYRIGSR